jgi:hypothetical protein
MPRDVNEMMTRRMSGLSVYDSWFLSGEPQVRLPALRSAILSEIFLSFPQTIQANSVTEKKPDQANSFRLLPNPPFTGTLPGDKERK